MEIWKDIEGWEDKYQVSNLGRIKSLARRFKRGDGLTVNVEEKILKTMITKDGYERAKLNLMGGSKKYSVHRLVANAFIPNLENKPQVNHIDGNKLNNKVENLEWCTAKENVNHITKLGTHSRMHKVRIYNDKEDLIFTTKKHASFYLGFKYDAIGRAIKLGWKEINGYKIELIVEKEFKNNLIKFNHNNIDLWTRNLTKGKIYNLIDSCIVDDRGEFLVIDKDRIRFFELIECL